MRKRALAELWFMGLPLVAAAALAVSAMSPANPGPISSTGKASDRLAGKVSYVRVSPPQAGVRLIEDILNRVRSVPQLAMVKNKLQSQEVVQQSKEGPTDYRLAIKPRDIQWYQAPGAQAGWKSGRSISRAKGVWEKDKDSEQFEAEAKRKSDVTTYGSPRGNVWSNRRNEPAVVTMNAPQEANKGIWERQNESAIRSLSPTSREALSSAAGKLYGITNKIAQVNEMASGAYGGGAGGPASNMAFGERSDDGASSFKKASRTRSQVAATGTELRDTKGVEEMVNAAPLPTPRPGAGTIPLPSPAAVASNSIPSLKGGFSPKQAIQLLDESGQAAGEDAPDMGTLSTLDAMMKREGQLQVALLPPNVVMGIPLMRLGVSQSQAAQTLATVGNMDQHKVNGWTVWSYHKQGAKLASLQVYMRHGLVEALRIFDNSFVGSDFGVRLGDDLAAVKRRFGEPAFIVGEPRPGAGQNYVYPISQVAFLMARPAPNQPPQVVSLLIFNVK